MLWPCAVFTTRQQRATTKQNTYKQNENEQGNERPTDWMGFRVCVTDMRYNDPKSRPIRIRTPPNPTPNGQSGHRYTPHHTTHFVGVPSQTVQRTKKKKIDTYLYVVEVTLAFFPAFFFLFFFSRGFFLVFFKTVGVVLDITVPHASGQRSVTGAESLIEVPPLSIAGEARRRFEKFVLFV